MSNCDLTELWWHKIQLLIQRLIQRLMSPTADISLLLQKQQIKEAKNNLKVFWVFSQHSLWGTVFFLNGIQAATEYVVTSGFHGASHDRFRIPLDTNDPSSFLLASDHEGSCTHLQLAKGSDITKGLDHHLPLAVLALTGKEVCVGVLSFLPASQEVFYPCFLHALTQLFMIGTWPQ